MKTHDRIAQIIAAAGTELAAGQDYEGEGLVRNLILHAVRERTRRKAGGRLKLKIWIADGFRCQYSGDLLFFPGYLTALSVT